jgi:ankyrin repeat protein
MDKNPLDNDGVTPLHDAAMGNHFGVCKLITENTEDKNPMSNNGRTPSDIALEMGHFGLLKLFKQSQKLVILDC